MIKKNYIKYIFFVFLFSLLILLSSCNKGQEKKKDEMLSIFNQIEELDKKINDNEYYQTSFYFNVDDTEKGNIHYEENECIVKKDLSYISKMTKKDNNINEYDYYTCKDNQYYHLTPIDDKEYEIEKIDDFDLNNIIGFDNPLPSKEIVNDIKKITIKDGEYRIPYSLVKDSSLVKRMFDYGYFNDLNDYLSDDELLVHFSFKCYESQYSVSCSFWYVKDNSSIKTEIVLTKDILKNQDDLNLDFKQQKTIREYKESKINILSEGEEALIFTPKYSGYYDINLDLSNSVNVKFGEDEYNDSNIKITKLLNSHEKYYINIKNGKSITEGKVLVTYSDKVNMDNISMRAYDTYVLKLDKIKGIKELVLNNKNIFIYKTLYKIDTDNDYPYAERKTSEIFYYEENEYYILLRNRNNNDIEDISINITDIDEIKIGCINELGTLSEDMTYFRINNEVGGQYKVNFFRFVNMYFYNENGLPLGVNFGEISMDAGKTYYLGLRNASDELCTIELQKLDDEYQWEITGGKYDSYRTFEEAIKLEADYTYNIKFIKNGEIVDCVFKDEFQGDRYNSQYSMHISEDGELEIPKEILNEESNWLSIYIKIGYIIRYDKCLDVKPI